MLFFTVKNVILQSNLPKNKHVTVFNTRGTMKTTHLLIARSIPLHDKNWFQTGGAARFFCEPKTAEEFAQALEFARQKELPIFVLGSGANILISDDGFDGLVIRPALTDCSHVALDETHALLTCGAGVTIAQAIDYSLKNSLLGLEEFSGIPGTIGGSIFINIHYYEHALGNFVHSGTIINAKTGAIEEVDRDWFKFNYDDTALMKGTYYLVSATFNVRRGGKIDVAYASGRREEISRHRIKRFPNHHTCGSFFRNFHDDEVTLTSSGKKLIFVAYYLDKIGVKGELKVGDAIVSYQHANMLVNQGKATSDDLIELARKMQELVYDQFKIIPQPECQLIGFKEYPLMK
jgi:UDP-N-acetylmuramate dehydrogenase